jgi:DNA polymerase IV
LASRPARISRQKDLAFLREHFGAQADYLYRAARGIDLRRVEANRPRKSLGGERTFARDISSGPALRAALEEIVAIVWARIAGAQARGRTVTLKLRTADFATLTRARSLPHAIASEAEFAAIGLALLEDLLPLPQPARLMGLTLSALEEREAPPDPDDAQLTLL